MDTKTEPEGITEKCQTCGNTPKDRTEEKVINLTQQCTKCIIEKREIKETNAKICSKCLSVTYPLNTFLNNTRTEWLCNGCSIKENIPEGHDEQLRRKW